MFPYLFSSASGRKRITVVFRGSVTKQDFLTDASIHMKPEENPMASFPHQDKVIKFHGGFYGKKLSPLFNCPIQVSEVLF